MAICRCENHNPHGNYVIAVAPAGWQQITSSICGNPTCQQPGIIWLNKSEAHEHELGRRIFSFATNTTKVKVEDRVVHKNLL
jgi:hypothetical protein